ncbi:MAG: hypothetical protein ACPGXL_07360 [Chitinophagales bacterium]
MKRLFSIILVLFLFVVVMLTCNTVQEVDWQPATDTRYNFELSDVWLVKTDRVQISASPRPKLHQDWYQQLEVSIEETVVFIDTLSTFTTYRGLLPIVHELDSGALEILLGFFNQQFHGQIVRIRIKTDNSLGKIDTLPLFQNSHADVDKDGVVEFMGYLHPSKTYCRNCDSVYYNPLLIYEMRSNGFCLDSSATKNWIERHYQTFEGWQPDSMVVVGQKPQVLNL